MTAEKIAQKIKNANEKAIKKLLLRAQEIERRGLSNEDIILQLVADEYESGYKTPKFFNAGMYDKMNYMCRCYMESLCISILSSASRLRSLSARQAASFSLRVILFSWAEASLHIAISNNKRKIRYCPMNDG